MSIVCLISLRNDDLPDGFDFTQVKLLPPNMTPLLQPMDQQVISNFEKLNTRALFQKCFEVTNDMQLKLMEFWKDHFTVLNCLTLIDNAWTQVTYRTLNSAWKKLWPDSVAERDFESDDSALIDGVVSMGKSMGLKVERDDIHEHLKSHKIELNTEELKHLHEEQQKTLADDLSSDEDEVRESVPSSLIKEMCAKWREVQLLVETYHPDTMMANMAAHSLNDTAMMHFRKILQCRQQLTLNKFLVKKARKATAEEEESAGSKRQRREKTPKGEL